MDHWSRKEIAKEALSILVLSLGWILEFTGGAVGQMITDSPPILNRFDIPFIDAHSQVGEGLDLNDVIKLMDQGGVARTILSTREKIPSERVLSLAADHPGRIVPAVRTKGYMERPAFNRLIKTQIDIGQFGAMAEVLMYHAQKGLKAPEIVFYPNHEKVRTALSYALDKKWPFVVHIEFEAAGPRREDFMRGLKEMLVQYPFHPFVLIHMGQLDRESARHLLEGHANIYFMTSHSNPITLKESKQPWINMFDGNRLATEWKQLTVKYPERFILGFDNVWPEHWGKFYLDQVVLWRDAIRDLPAEVAHAFAHGNAERLWRLPPSR